MYVRELTPEESKQFYSLAELHGHVFSSQDWCNIFGSKLVVFGLFAKKSNQLSGGFFLFKDLLYGVPYLRNPPFTPHVSLFYVNRSSNPANVNSFQKKISFAVAAHLLKYKLAFVNIALPYYEKDVQPYIWSHFKIKVRYTYHLDLALSEKELLGNMSPERRNDLSKALKDGIEVRVPENLAVIQDMVTKTYTVNKLNAYENFLQKIFTEFATPSNSIGLVAYQSGVPLACTFCVYNDKAAYYILGGYNRDNRHHGAGAICIWETIKAAKQRNIRYFDFEGSMVPAIESFFRGFGGNITPFYQLRKYPFNLKY
jgi:lipid II:glycine glycyltransferase (peptidoglycan interpeptide bridge formation enzyme)